MKMKKELTHFVANNGLTAQAIQKNSSCITREVDWFSRSLEKRFHLYFKGNGRGADIYDIRPPDLSQNRSPYAKVVNHYEMAPPERLVLLMSFLPHIKPEILDTFFIKNETTGRTYTEFGGIVGNSHGGFLPTGETAMFLISGNKMEDRLAMEHVFSNAHFFRTHNILKLTDIKQEEPFLSGALTMSGEFIEILTTGRPFRPSYTSRFPAKLITTPYEWDELVLEESAMEQVKEIVGWVRYGDMLLKDWGLNKKIKPGFKSLFYGPPGTGKTLTACLLGKLTGLDVFRIDLSMMISKFIGETEKNLANVFDQAENKNWILFFDEADSLFSKRTETNSSNDRSANQQVSYLLQRMEDFPGVVILASNLKSNIDEAFQRRFQSMVSFAMPGAEERLKLWEQCFKSKNFKLDKEIDFQLLAEDFEIAGGNIINILRYACIQTVMRNSDAIKRRDIIKGVQKEFSKMGKTVGTTKR